VKPKEKPILFGAPMVRALLSGTKTQSRRIMKPQPSEDCGDPIAVEWYAPIVVDRNGDEQPGADVFGVYWEEEGYRCPYGAPGDLVWVRETWAAPHNCDHLKPREIDNDWRIHYAADGALGGLLVRPSIFMPRWASRIDLEVTDVRVERLQDISRGDAMDEGCPFPNMAQGPDPRQWYADLWRQINGADSWDANPWVWCLSFRKMA
jgi:hypothetical protein